MFTGPVQYICNARENPLRMLNTIKLQVHSGHRSVILTFIVCETLAASATVGADYCDQHVKARRPKRRLVELESGDCIPIVQMPRGHLQTPPSSGITHLKNNSRPSSIIQVAEETILPAHSQTWVLVQLPWVGTGALQLYSPLYKNILPHTGRWSYMCRAKRTVQNASFPT